MDNIRQYERRLMSLEWQFFKARRSIERLSSKISCNPGKVEKANVKMQLDLAVGLIRLLKEQAAFYVKLGDVYDIVRFHEEFVQELERRDRALAAEIVEEMASRWSKE